MICLPPPPVDVSIPRDVCGNHVTRPALGVWLCDRGDKHMLYFYLWVGGGGCPKCTIPQTHLEGPQRSALSPSIKFQMFPNGLSMH